ncbi:MAG: helix-turn-helix transcriptional regulator [Acidaminococcaceae bacterium]|nr:helix-turn-helix transcriptional regulator [Acidaminococcaceae bacterium]
MKLYENIRARRIALKMTQQELAAKLGYKSTSTIAKIESGENDIPQSKIVAFARALETTPGAFPVDMENIIGTDIFHVASHQGGTPSPDYTFTQDDEILRGGFASFNMKMNKVANIVREIGKQPVLAFGNSSGDAGMFNCTITRNKHKALAFSLLCDDLVRELGSKEKSEKMRAACEEFGWIPISMRDDFKTIYGDRVTREK